MKLTLTFLVIAMVFGSCRTQNFLVQKNISASEESIIDSVFGYNPNYQYQIRKDDKISISVWNQDELSIGSVYGIYNSNEVYGKWLMVDANGNIEIPKLGTCSIVGLTIPQVKDSLKNLFQKWIVNPIVDVKVLNKEITLLGELKNPGVVKIDKDQNTLLEMLSRAGGTEFYANIKKVKVLRQEGVNVRITNIDLTKEENFLKKNIILHPGDVVIVPSKRYKEFDKRVSTIIPFTTTINALSILFGFL